MDTYVKVFNQRCFDVNENIVKKLNQLKEEDFKDKTHLFHGRYENIYLEADKLPELGVIIDTALDNAANILNIKKENLAFGFWLNAMAAGDITTAHTHDDDDELLSCVYYIKVPSESGDLIITEGDKKITIKPEEGSFIFFPPDTLHEVSKNKSEQPRLSIAFNFGLVRT